MKIARAMPFGALTVCSALALLVTGCSSDGGSGSADSAAATTPTIVEATTTTAAGPPVDPVTGAGAPEVVADGYGFLEGVTWQEDDDTLLVADKAGQLLEVGADDQVTVIDPDSDRGDIDGDGNGGLSPPSPTSARSRRRPPTAPARCSPTAWTVWTSAAPTGWRRRRPDALRHHGDHALPDRPGLST